MQTLMKTFTLDEFNRLHARLGGVRPVVDHDGQLDMIELGMFVYAAEQALQPKQPAPEIPGQLSLFDASEYDVGG